MLSPFVRMSSHGDGAVLLNTANGQMFTLNAVAARMVASMGEGLNAEAIADRISRECSIPTDQVGADLANLMAALRSRGLLQATPV